MCTVCTADPTGFRSQTWLSADLPFLSRAEKTSSPELCCSRCRSLAYCLRILSLDRLILGLVIHHGLFHLHSMRFLFPWFNLSVSQQALTRLSDFFTYVFSIGNVERCSPTISGNPLRILSLNVWSCYILRWLWFASKGPNIGSQPLYNLLAGSYQYSWLSIESEIRLLCRTVLHRSSFDIFKIWSDVVLSFMNTFMHSTRKLAIL
jgi:hypothetical protein